MAAPPRRLPRLHGPARLLVLWLCLWGGLLQATVGQTHVHAASLRAQPSAAAEMAPLAPAEAGCLLCEIAGHTPVLAPPGAMPAPSVAAPRGTAAPPDTARERPTRPSHHWHGRGPPVPA